MDVFYCMKLYYDEGRLKSNRRYRFCFYGGSGVERCNLGNDRSVCRVIDRDESFVEIVRGFKGVFFVGGVLEIRD